MASPFIAQITIFAGNFAPQNYAFCNGQIVSIAQNTALFSLVGTTYGGNGQTTFALPDLRGRLPMHTGQGPGLSNRVLGEKGGTASVTLLTAQMPAHTHTSVSPGAATVATSANPLGLAPSAVAGGLPYATAGGAAMASVVGTVGSAGSSMAHNNLMPALALNFIVALQGIFPSRN
jgi:microcystin-dependent protein